MCIKPSLALFFQSGRPTRFYQGYLCYAHNSNSPVETMPLTAQGRDHLLLLAPLLLNKSPLWQMLLLFTSTDSLMAPFLLPPGTSDHLLLSGEAEETTYTITTLFFRVLPSWHTWVTEQSRCPTKLCGSKTTYKCITLSLKETHHVSATWFPNTHRYFHEHRKKLLKKLLDGLSLLLRDIDVVP